MKIISNAIRSLRKSKKLKELQLQLHPPDNLEGIRTSDDIVKEVFRLSERDELLKQYLDLCQDDPNVKEVMNHCGLTREDLLNIYKTLKATCILNQWVKGHHAALSTIAYPAPLYFYAKLSSQGHHPHDVANILLEYWEDKISDRSLIMAAKDID